MISCKKVYNDYLKMRKEAYYNEGRRMTYFDCVKDLPRHMQEYKTLKDADSQALRMSLKQLDNDYNRFFNTRQNYPQFIKNTDDWRYYKTTNNGNNTALHPYDVRLPKLGRVSTVNPEDKWSAEVNQIPPGRILYTIVRYKNKKFTATLYYTTEEVTDRTVKQP